MSFLASKNYETLKLDPNNYQNISTSLFYSAMFYLFILCFFSFNCCCCCNNNNETEINLNRRNTDIDSLFLGDIQKDRKNFFYLIFQYNYFLLY